MRKLKINCQQMLKPFCLLIITVFLVYPVVLLATVEEDFLAAISKNSFEEMRKILEDNPQKRATLVELALNHGIDPLGIFFSFNNYYNPSSGGSVRHAKYEATESLTQIIDDLKKCLKDLASRLKSSGGGVETIDNNVYFNLICDLIEGKFGSDGQLTEIRHRGTLRKPSASAGVGKIDIDLFIAHVYLAHLKNMRGISIEPGASEILAVSKAPRETLLELIREGKARNLETWSQSDYLFLHAWSLISLIIRIENGVIDTSYMEKDKELVIDSLIYELAITVEALSNYLEIFGLVNDPTYKAILKKISNLKVNQEYVIASGCRSSVDHCNHAIYIVFERICTDYIAIRIDNREDETTNVHRHLTEGNSFETLKVAPKYIALIPIGCFKPIKEVVTERSMFFQFEDKPIESLIIVSREEIYENSMLDYLEKIMFSVKPQELPGEEIITALYTIGDLANLEGVVWSRPEKQTMLDQLAATKVKMPIQKVANCVVSGWEVGELIRLGNPLYELVKNQEINFAIQFNRIWQEVKRTLEPAITSKDAETSTSSTVPLLLQTVESDDLDAINPCEEPPPFKRKAPGIYDNWYTDDRVRQLLEYYLPKENFTVIAPAAVIFENGTLLTNAVTTAVHEALDGKIVVMPMHLHGNHWVGAIFIWQGGENTIQVIYNDPLGRAINDEHNAELWFSTIRQVIQEVHPNPVFNFIDLKLCQQRNGDDCGPFTIDNLVKLARRATELADLDREKIINLASLQQPLDGKAHMLRQQHDTDLPQQHIQTQTTCQQPVANATTGSQPQQWVQLHDRAKPAIEKGSSKIVDSASTSQTEDSELLRANRESIEQITLATRLDNRSFNVRPRWTESDGDCAFHALNITRKKFVEELDQIYNNSTHSLYNRVHDLFAGAVFIGQYVDYNTWRQRINDGLWAGDFEINLIGLIRNIRILIFRIDSNNFRQQLPPLGPVDAPTEVWIAHVNASPVVAANAHIRNHYIELQPNATAPVAGTPPALPLTVTDSQLSALPISQMHLPGYQGFQS